MASLFECMDMRKKLDLSGDVVSKLGQQVRSKMRASRSLPSSWFRARVQYIRQTADGWQCAACGMFLVAYEHRWPPRYAPLRNRAALAHVRRGCAAT
jgi:hypothetical protein